MPYCTVDDIKGQMDERDLVQLTDDEDTGAVVMSHVDKAIADADAEMNGYLGARYSLPLDPVPPVINKYAVDIAIFNLESRRGGASDNRTARYDKAIKYMELVAKGTISLGVGDPDETPRDSEAPKLASTNPPRLFSRESMKDF